MKKWIAFLLAVVMVLGLAACGGEVHTPPVTQPTQNPTSQTGDSGNRPETEPTQPTETFPPQPAETEPAGNQAYSLQFSAMEHPVIPALQWQPQGDYTVAKTPLDCDVDVLFAQLQTIPYFQEHFTNITNTREETCESAKNGERSLRVSDTIFLSNEDDASIRFVFSRNVTSYANYDSVYFYTSDTDLTAQLQDALCQALENAGMSMMKYVLTAQDPDGKTSYGNEFSEHVSADDSLSEKVVSEDGVDYTLSRDIENDLDDMSCSIYIGYHTGTNNNYSSGSFVSVMDSAPYNFSNLVSADFGGSNPLDTASFGDKLLGSSFADYRQTSVPELSAVRVYSKDGVTKYTFAMRLTYESTETDTKPASFKYALTYKEKDGEVYDVDVCICSYDLENTKNGASQEVLYNEVMRIVQTMISGVDLSGFSYENTKTMGSRTIWRSDISATIFGQEISIPDVMIIYDGEEIELSLNLNLQIAVGLG